jgi:NADH dehydrogenase
VTDRRARRIFVAGGTGFVGYRVVRSLLDEGADVTVLVRPDSEEKLGALRHRVRQVQGDAWNPGSLRGRARGHDAVVHLMGGLKPDPKRGLTFRHLNFVSARNVAQMAVNDGVVHFVLLSASVAPLGVASGYLESKREAERYIQKSGLAWTIVRAPALYAPGGMRNPLSVAMSLVSRLPLLGILFAPYAPMSVDLAARGIASLALTGDDIDNRMIAPGALRRIGRAAERRYTPPPEAFRRPDQDDDEPPFGWLPPFR